MRALRDEDAFRQFQGFVKDLQSWEDAGEIELYYFDESGFSQRSNLPYGWSPVGKPTQMKSYPHNKRLNVLGFMSRRQKLIFHATEERVDSAKVVALFNKLAESKDPLKPAVVLLDNASMHRSAEFRRHRLDWMDKGIWPIYLPKYSPELNLIEILWRKVKYSWLPLDSYETFDRLKESVNDILSKFGQEYKINFV
ncbi:IS630 family transposase [Hahella chejuensis]|uniref:IS630 family transposase n=1 Tax=Hahella chejuensis TaxID=158327 RepID=UPI0011D0CACC|nr:IS630 family transposase [Hahella chejuensis]